MSGLYCGFHHNFAIFENLDTSLEETLLFRWVLPDALVRVVDIKQRGEIGL
jgi:hypothetical protein